MRQEVLTQLHNVELEIMDEIDRICTINSIKYYLVGGSLLGAVRHQGFIPWDDDLDIAMPRKELIRFSECCKTQLSEKFFLQDFSSDESYMYVFSKVRKRNTAFIQENLKSSSMYQGIFVDIFPLDDGDNDIPKEEKKLERIKKIQHNLYIRGEKRKKNWKQKILSIVPRSFLIKYKDRLLAGKGDYYVNYGSQYGLVKQTIEKIHYDEPVRISFEGRAYNAPKDYEYILCRLYGEKYMQLPPEEKRVTHNPLRISFDLSGPDEELD